jgi:glutathione S-transferase
MLYFKTLVEPMADLPGGDEQVRIALAELNATDKVEFVAIDVLAGEHKTDSFIEKNPAGGVPVLELGDGTYIAESSAIIDYLDMSFGGTLTGQTARQRALISMFQRRAEFMVLDAISAYFHHATAGLGPELETYQNKAWGDHQHSKALDGLHYFENVLSENEYVTGETFTAADITLYAGFIFAGFANIDIPTSYVNLRKWKANIESRPSIKGL